LEKKGISILSFLKALLSIAHRIPYIVKSYAKLLTLDGESHESWGTLMERNAEKYPNRPALKWKNSSMTYSELNEWANRFSHYFISKGLKKGEVVSVFLENRSDLFIIYCAIAKIGAVASMINTNQKGQSLLHSMNHIPSKIYITGEEVIDSFQEIRAGVKTAKENNLFAAVFSHKRPLSRVAGRRSKGCSPCHKTQIQRHRILG
jgi:citronellyl-CoA synthetase